LRSTISPKRSPLLNFAITILEIWPDHNRVVYCWTTTRRKHTERVKKGIVKENNFYAYCVRKVRDLMKNFNTEYIIMDSQGGGYAILEGFHDTDKLEESEQPIWEIIEEDKEKPSDSKAGLHILKLVHFRDNKWLIDANHGLKKDMLDKFLIFPYFDPLSLQAAAESEKLIKQKDLELFDTLEDCVFEIEKMKDEIASIQHSLTPNGTEHWDSPPVIMPGGKKGRTRKDRYSALIMANWMARSVIRGKLNNNPYSSYAAIGGLAKSVADGLSGDYKEDKNSMYVGPDWFTRAIQEGSSTYGKSITHTHKR